MKKKILLVIILLILIISSILFIKKPFKNNIKEESIKQDRELSKNNEVEDIPIDKQNKLYGGINGTADKLEGKTVIISIYANELTYKWNYDNEEDNNTINDTLDNIRIATEYLTKQAEKYNKNAEFIYNWQKYSDLKYQANFNEDIVSNYKDNYVTQREWIVNNIDIDKIIDKYSADNLLVMYFFNTDSTNTSITSTYSKYDIDVIDVFIENDRYIIPTATYAHEILHTFGAPDLYFENAKITQEYVDYLKDNNTNDIMAKVNYGKEIINSFSDLDAYYVGLIDKCDEVDKWNLGISDHIKVEN